MKSKCKRLAGAILAVLMLCSCAATALAANDSLPPDKGSLTIHKYLMDDVEGANKPNNGHEAGTNGNPDIPAGAVALEGVTFGVWQIDTKYDANGNLTSPVEFPTTAAEAEAMLEDGTLTMTKIGDYTTGVDGTVKIGDLDKGYYYVKELKSANVQIATATEPFLVAVPMTDASEEGANTKWITDVHVYPKNSPLQNSKVVNDAMVSTGEYYETDNTLTWKINSDIPSNIGDAAASISGATGGYFRIIDELDKSFIYQTGTLKVYAGMTKDAETVELVESTDYNLHVGEKTDESATVITVDLTQAGMEKLAAGVDSAGVPYSNLYITFTTKLDANATQNAMIKNTPKTYFSADPTGNPGDPSDPDNPIPDPDDPNEPTTPDPEDIPYVIVGKLSFTKTSEDGTSPLQGAKFKIATSEANAKNGVYLKVNGTGDDVVATSDSSGVVTFTNLPITPEFDEHGTFTGFQEEAYWLVEVEAPAGYNLLQSPIKVPVLDDIAENEKVDGTPVPDHVVFKDGVDRINNVELKVVNTKNFTLPQTGGTGTVIFTVVGIVLMGTAGLLLVMTKKKTNKEK